MLCLVSNNMQHDIQLCYLVKDSHCLGKPVMIKLHTLYICIIIEALYLLHDYCLIQYSQLIQACPISRTPKLRREQFWESAMPRDCFNAHTYREEFLHPVAYYQHKHLCICRIVNYMKQTTSIPHCNMQSTLNRFSKHQQSFHEQIKSRQDYLHTC